MTSFPKVSCFRDKVQAEHDGGDKVGKTTKLKLTHAVSELLVWNEKQKLTDEQLAEMLEAEFPKREAAGERAAKKKEGNVDRPRTLQSISAYRGYFNSGKHGHNPDGMFGHSSSYNAEGVARATGNGKPKAAKKTAKKAAKKTAKKAAKKTAKKAAPTALEHRV